MKKKIAIISKQNKKQTNLKELLDNKDNFISLNSLEFNENCIEEFNEEDIMNDEEIWLHIPGNMIQDIQLGDGTNFIEKYGDYDKYEFEILLGNKK